MTHASHDGAERLPALRDDELSPEVALVDPDVAERARAALPEITLTEIRLSLSLKAGRAAAPDPHSPSEPVAVSEPAPARAPALLRPADPPAPPAYEDIHPEFHGPRRRRRATLVALVILGVAAGVALALPRPLDGPSSPTPANRKASSGPPVRSSSAAPTHDVTPKRTSTANAKADKRATPHSTRHARASQKAKRAPKKHAVAPPAPTRHVPRHKAKAPPVRPHARVIPDFVWAPAKNASGYLVEFRAGSRVVLRVRTRAARLHVAAKQLHQGRYRWLVWSLGNSGAPIGTPLVDSSLKVR